MALKKKSAIFPRIGIEPKIASNILFNNILVAAFELTPFRNITRTNKTDVAKVMVCPRTGKKFNRGSSPKRKPATLNLLSNRVETRSTHLSSCILFCFSKERLFFILRYKQVSLIYCTTPSLILNVASGYLKYVEIYSLLCPLFQISAATRFLVLFYGKKNYKIIITRRSHRCYR